MAKATASRDSSLPDPFNMAKKASVRFSVILGAKLLPACQGHDSDGSSSSSDEEMNTSQGDNDDEWSACVGEEDISSLLRSFGHSASMVSG